MASSRQHVNDIRCRSIFLRDLDFRRSRVSWHSNTHSHHRLIRNRRKCGGFPFPLQRLPQQSHQVLNHYQWTGRWAKELRAPSHRVVLIFTLFVRLCNRIMYILFINFTRLVQRVDPDVTPGPVEDHKYTRVPMVLYLLKHCFTTRLLPGVNQLCCPWPDR